MSRRRSTPAGAAGVAVMARQTRKRPTVGEVAGWSLLATAGTLLLAILVVEDRVAIGLFGVSSVIVLVLLRIHIWIALLLPSVVGLYSMRGTRPVETIFTSLPYDVTASWSLSVVPMFILMGTVLAKSGVIDAIYVAADRWLNWLPGSRAVATNVAGAGLGAVTGSAVGATYTVVRLGLPGMLRAGYSKRIALASVLMAAVPSQLIPPSVIMVIYAGIAETPVGPQLLAGLLPGLGFSLLACATFVVLALIRPGSAPRDRSRYSTVERLAALPPLWPVVLIGTIVLGGIFSGAFTTTEAGAIAAGVAIVVLILKRRKNAFRELLAAAVSCVATVGSVLILIVCATALTRMMTLSGITARVADWMIGLELGTWGFLLVLTIMFFVLGMIMEDLSMMLLMVPVLLPVLPAYDVSPLWFGVLVVFLVQMGSLMPPVGILSFMTHGFVQDPDVNVGFQISIRDVFGAVLMFCPLFLVFCIALIQWPEVATWLPGLAEG